MGMSVDLYKATYSDVLSHMSLDQSSIFRFSPLPSTASLFVLRKLYSI
jgi:hypothetical protein